MVLTAVEQNGDALRYASKTLKNDRAVVLEAVGEYGPALSNASQTLQNDKGLLLLRHAGTSKFNTILAEYRTLCHSWDLEHQEVFSNLLPDVYRILEKRGFKQHAVRVQTLFDEMLHPKAPLGKRIMKRDLAAAFA